MKKKLLLSVLSASACQAFAAASTVEQSMNNVMASMDGLTNLISGASYLMAVAMGMSALVGLKRHSESQGRESLSAPMVKMVMSAMMLGLPSLLGSVQSSLLPDGGFPPSNDAKVARSAPVSEPVQEKKETPDVSPDGWDAKTGRYKWSVDQK